MDDKTINALASGEPDPHASRHGSLRRVLRSRLALQRLREIEAELREQAMGEQDGYLLSIATRMREALASFQ